MLVRSYSSIDLLYCAALLCTFQAGKLECVLVFDGEKFILDKLYANVKKLRYIYVPVLLHLYASTTTILLHCYAVRSANSVCVCVCMLCVILAAVMASVMILSAVFP